MKYLRLQFAVILLLIGSFASGAHDAPIKVDPKDFKFVATVASPPGAVKAEEAAWRNEVRLKYSGKTVTVTGLVFKSGYGGDDLQVSVVKRIGRKSADGKPPQRPPAGSFPVYVKLAASGFVLSKDMVGKERTVTGTARVQAGRLEAIYLRIEGARVDD
jgi:hypothetical protein